MTRRLALCLSALALVAACGGADLGASTDDATGLPYAEGSQQALAILAVANDTSLGVAELSSPAEVGLDSRAAKNIVAHRDGPDPVSTADDDPFDMLGELYGVPYCKRTCLERLLAYAKKTGVYDDVGQTGVYVIFSPQPADKSHLVEIAKLIDRASSTIDIAMYSYSHQDPIRGALERAVGRGVKIRFLADTDLAVDAGKAGGLEKLGIDVRRVTKIMHHKFALIDGPRDDASLERARTSQIITGSGNWSSSAGTIYDENTVFLAGYPELALRLQRDFDTLWAGSKDQVYDASLVWDQTRANITDELIAEHESPNSHAWFTSANFKSTSGGGWSYLGTSEVTDRLVAGIDSAKSSVRIASGHFLSLPIVQAVANATARPGMKVEVALDCQETSKDGEVGKLKDAIEAAGGTIYYKCNTYRWHYKYAKQLHDKYIVVDDAVLFTGSLNFSDNAESNTFENMLMFKGPEHAALIKGYAQNHAKLLSYGRENDLAALAELHDEIANGSSVPLVWETPLSIDLATFDELKDLIRSECPATKGWEGTPEAKTYNKWFNQYPQWFVRCQKSGYPWPDVPEDMRVK